MYDFTYVRPASIAEAVGAMGQSPEARVMAGGQTLIPTMKQRLAKPSTVIDLGGLQDLRGIIRDGNALGIGAMTTHAEVAGSQIVSSSIRALSKLAGNIGDPQVRNRGTLGGSIANNDPAADYPSAVLALGATIVTNKRKIKADDYFKGMFTTALEPGEIITGVGFPVPEKAGYAKFEQRASRFALVGVFVAKFASAVRVAVTGAGEGGVFRVPEFERALMAKFAPEALTGVAGPSTGLLGDIHGSPEYRANLIQVMAGRAVAQSLA